jgi:hypothetical protein
MTTPTGTDEARDRNATALARLDDDARPTIGAAVHEMLAAILAAPAGATPTVEAVTSTARSSWRNAVQRVLAWVRETFARLAGRAADNLPDDTAPVLTPATLEQRVDALAAQLAQALDGVPDVVASRVATTLREGWARGEAPDELYARVAAALDRQEWDDEIERLVRTTTTTVYNAAHTAVADALEADLGTPLRRMWIATMDDRTRATHRAAHLQVINSGDTFTVGGVPMRFPGDPLAPPRETVNCRCVVTAVVDDFVIDLAHRVTGPEADALTDLANDPDTDQPTTASAAPVLAAMPAQLVTYWARGEGAAKIRWGTGGDFGRCERALRKYLRPDQLGGACANLHKIATGKWPAEKGTQEDSMPCACEDTTDPAAVTAVTLEETMTMGMIALLPSEADATRLAVDGGIPAEDLHVTLMTLGEGTQWQGTPEGEELLALAERVAADVGPITGRLWARTEINPDSDEPTAAYLVGDDTGRLGELQAGLVMATAGWPVPEQHSPFVPHLSTRYESADLAGMEATGSDVALDRLRVTLGNGQVVDFPLSGDDTLDTDDDRDDAEEELVVVDETGMLAPVEAATDAPAPAQVAAAAATAVDDLTPTPAAQSSTPVPRAVVVASQIAAADDVLAVVAEAAANAPAAPPKEWFEPVAVDGPTPPTVTAQGRVWGHIGQAGVCHAGIPDTCVTIPPTRTAYGAFHRGEQVTAEGDTVRVGYLYTGCGHSGLDTTLDEARDYLDSACVRTAAGRVHDTEWGPLFVGALVPGVTAADVARLYKLSGEWFTAPLELHAAVGVEDAGFPVDGTTDHIQISDVEPTLLAPILDTELVAAAVVNALDRRAVARETAAAALTAAGDSARRAVARYVPRGVN